MLSRLSVSVLSALRALKERPALAADPLFLEHLAKEARGAFDGGHVTLAAPIAPNTTEVSGLLAGDATAPTARIPLTFPWPVEVLGFYVACVPTPAAVEPPGSVPATADDVQVAIDFNNEVYVTQSGITAGGGSTESFVTLAAMGVQVPRLTGIRIVNAAPVMGVRFRLAVPPSVKRVQGSRLVVCPLYRQAAV